MLWAAENGHLTTVQFLLKQGANPRYRHPCGDSALQYASRSGQIDVLKLLIPLVNGEADYPTFFGQFTSLHEAASCGQSDVVKVFIFDWKANPNALSQIGQTPLMLAVSREDNLNYWKCIQILLKGGARTDIQDYVS
jgi:ankyrin repeat protein